MSADGGNQKEQIYSKVVGIVGEVLDIDTEDKTITPETRFVEDLGAESLDMAQFVMTLEDEFEKPIDDEQLMELKTVQDAVDYIHKQLTEPDE